MRRIHWSDLMLIALRWIVKNREVIASHASPYLVWVWAGFYPNVDKYSVGLQVI